MKSIPRIKPDVAMRIPRIIFSVIFLVLFISGCATPVNSFPSPTFTSSITLTQEPTNVEETPTLQLLTIDTPSTEISPTLSAQSETPIPMVTPTLVSSPTSSQLAPTSALRPTWTRTPSKTPIPPLAGIRITRPGLQSRVLSPFRMEANAIPSPDGLVFLELMGEDGRLLFQKTIRFLPTSESVFIQQEVEFSINGVSEAARLSIFTLDPYNRLISLSSVDLVLLSIGDEQITQPLNIRESIYIIQPYLNQAFSQGLVSIRGLISPTSSQPLKVELITADNIVLYSFELEVGEVTSDRRYYPFEFSFPFSVDSVTPSRLSLFQESDNRLAGIMAFSSQTIYLYP